MIHLQGVTKTYKQHTALVNIDLSVAAGECFGLIGTNGAGRTTLLNILATLTRPTGGRATIAGLDVVRQAMQVRQRLGYVAESQSFDEMLRVHEYLDFLATTYRLPAQHRQAAIDAILTSTSLNPHDFINTLSKGCRQQLAFAAALLHESDVLLLDEPWCRVDPLVRQRCRTLLQERLQRGTAMLLACNTTEELQELCSRIGVLHRGRLVAVVEHTSSAGDLHPVLSALLAKHAGTES